MIKKLSVLFVVVALVSSVGMMSATAVPSPEIIYGLQVNAPPGYCGWTYIYAEQGPDGSGGIAQYARGDTFVQTFANPCTPPVANGAPSPKPYDNMRVQVTIHCYLGGVDYVGWAGPRLSNPANTAVISSKSNPGLTGSNWCGTSNPAVKMRVVVASWYLLLSGWYVSTNTSHWVDCTSC